MVWNGYTSVSVHGHTGITHPFQFSDIRALWRSVLSVRSECPNVKKLKRVHGYSMALNALIDSFCRSQEKGGTKRVSINILLWLYMESCTSDGDRSLRISNRRILEQQIWTNSNKHLNLMIADECFFQMFRHLQVLVDPLQVFLRQQSQAFVFR